MANTPTRSQRRRWSMVVALGCLPCQLDGIHGTPAGISHKHDHGYRDHDKVWPSCEAHHLYQHAVDGIPNRHKNSVEFRAWYGTDDELCEMTEKLLGERKMKTKNLSQLLLPSICFFVLLLACTPQIQKDKMLPGINYRPNPKVRTVEYDSWLELNRHCAGLQPWWLRIQPQIRHGCALVPEYASQWCTIHMMRGDMETYEHEYEHCQGKADLTANK